MLKLLNNLGMMNVALSGSVDVGLKLDMGSTDI